MKALQASPNDPEVVWRAASCKSFKGELAQATKLAEYALGLDAGCHQACAVLAATALIAGDYPKAEGYADRCLDIAPNMPSVMWNKAHCELFRGDYKNGFERWKWGRAAKLRWCRSIAPEWRGEPVKSLLVWCEQGHGDTIQFQRYLKDIEGRAEFVIFETYKQLLFLTLAQGMDVHTIGQPQDASCPYPYDAQISLLDLPALLGVSSPSDVSGKPYIKPSPVVSCEGVTQGRKVGIVWAGANRHMNDDNRSLKEEDLNLPLVSLQKQRECPKNWLDIGSSLNDYSQTAAVLSELDLLVTVDTSVAHLAGAMGVPTWLIVPLNGDWRWGFTGETTCWYDSVRLFRPKSMLETTQQIADELRGHRMESRESVPFDRHTLPDEDCAAYMNGSEKEHSKV